MMAHQRRDTMVDTTLAVIVIAVVVRVVVLRTRARDLGIAIPAGRKVTEPGSAQRSRLMRKMQGRKLSLITRMIKMKVVPVGKHSVEWLPDSWEMGNPTAD